MDKESQWFLGSYQEVLTYPTGGSSKVVSVFRILFFIIFPVHDTASC
jgi:hypothetical protein